ncbi:MAG: hypothetical protein CM15mP54_28540 [Paracoccaceae bacterium]|nr:MAG: hypothetical protein CM15mP54_28540 [Paracoccaceae bacterium]
MGFQLRQTDGSTFSSSSWIEPDGSLTSYGNMEFIARPLNLHTVGEKNFQLIGVCYSRIKILM